VTNNDMSPENIVKALQDARETDTEIQLPVDEFRRHMNSINLRNRMTPQQELQLDLSVWDLLAGGDGWPTDIDDSAGPWRD
jgi:hypothetical protein